MEITEAKVKLVSDKADKLKAFCTITIDREFVVRDIKIIKGTKGCFVAMPSRKLMDRCPSCGSKNHLRAAYCNECGGALRQNRVSHDPEGRAKLHADIAHPINSGCREKLQHRIIQAYEAELEASRKPGYVPASDDDVLDSFAAERPTPAADAPEPIVAKTTREPEAQDTENALPELEADTAAPEDATAPPDAAPGPPNAAENDDADSFASGIL